MILYNTPLVVVLAFLGLTLVLGLYVSNGATTFREYAVGNKRFHTNILVVTLLSTTFGGVAMMDSFLFVYDKGVSFIVFYLLASGIHYTAALMALRMGPFMAHLSIAETIGSVYGKYPRVIAASTGVCFLINIITFQITVASYFIKMCIDSIDYRTVTILATLVIIAYAMLGGARAVTITDVLQFVTFMTIIAIFIKFVFTKTGKSVLDAILTLRQEEKFQFSRSFQFDKKLLNLVQAYIAYAFYLNPSIIQRVYMSSSSIQAYKVFLRGTIFSIVISGGVVLIGLFIFVWNPTLKMTEIWPYIFSHISPAYKGCLIICVLGMTMSTADSCLHTASIMVSHDMVECVRGVQATPYIFQLRLAKLATLVIGLLSMMMSIYFDDIPNSVKFVMGSIVRLFLIISTLPLILAIFGFRGSSRTILIGMIIGVLFDLYWNKYVVPKIGVHVGIFHLLATGLGMMAAHYLLPQPTGKGWIGPDHQQRRMQNLIRAFKKYKNL